MSSGRFIRAALFAGYAFLWLPILLLVAYAFSADRIPFQWGGFSLRWFAALTANDRLVEAALLSLRVAAGAATLAVLLGGAAGWALARFGAFRGRAAFGALIGAPLVLPEVVTGLSLLLLFAAGALDNISVVVRSTLVQVLTPDEMLGRVSAVNNVFIRSSKELGGFE